MLNSYKDVKLSSIKNTLSEILQTIISDISSKLFFPPKKLDKVETYVKWINEQYNYKFKSNVSQKHVEKGEIYYCNFGQNIGSEQDDIRPAIILQNNIGNKYSPTTVVAPITTQIKKALPTHVNISDVKPDCTICGYILLEQIRCVSKARLLQRKDKVNVHSDAWKKIILALNTELDI